MGFKTSAKQGIAVNAPVPRRANGTIMPGFTANAGGRPRSMTEELKSRYRNRLPELMDGLFQLTTPNNPPMVRIAAVKELLDRIVGKSTVSIDAVTTREDVGVMYLQALQRAGISHAIPSEPVIDGDDDNSNTGAPRDPTEIIQ
jgi:hypothetical protein